MTLRLTETDPSYKSKGIGECGVWVREEGDVVCSIYLHVLIHIYIFIPHKPMIFIILPVAQNPMVLLIEQIHSYDSATFHQLIISK